MAIVVVAALVLYGIELISLVQLRREAKELQNEDLAYLEDAFRYTYIEEDFEQLEAEILKLKADLRYAI